MGSVRFTITPNEGVLWKGEKETERQIETKKKVERIISSHCVTYRIVLDSLSEYWKLKKRKLSTVLSSRYLIVLVIFYGTYNTNFPFLSAKNFSRYSQ